MPFDGLTISYLTQELNGLLEDQRIEKVYQPERDELTLLVRGKRKSHRLLISANSRWCRMYVSEERRENPTQPTAFCMLLRKHLEGGRILGFEQEGFDRIVRIRLEAMNEFMEWQEKVLVCEFTGKNSNIILIDPQKNIIVDAIKRYGHELSSYREVLPGETYVAPPTQDKLNPYRVSYDDFCQSIWDNASISVSRALFQRVTGFSPQTSVQLCFLAGIDPDISVDECGDYELSRLYDLISKPGELSKRPSLIGPLENPAEYFPFEPGVGDGVKITSFDSLNQAMDNYYSILMAHKRIESIRVNVMRNVKGWLEKAYRKLMFQEGDLREAEKADELRNCGELLTTYGFQITKGTTSVSLPNFDGEGETVIDLLPHLTPQENARRYFRQYTRARTARLRLQEFIQQNRLEIDYLESVVLALEKAETIGEIEEVTEELTEQGFVKVKSSRKKERRIPSTPRKFVSSEGLIILVGKNNHQNDELTFKSAQKYDIWFHSQGYHGTHVILQTGLRSDIIDAVPVASLEEAAILAAHYSRGKEAARIPVDYTFRVNVKKPRGARPGMVIYDSYWTINVDPNDPRLENLLQSRETA